LGNDWGFFTPILGKFLESAQGKLSQKWEIKMKLVLSQIWEIVRVFSLFLGNCCKTIREVNSQKWNIPGKIKEQLVTEIWKIIGYFTNAWEIVP